MFNIKIFGKFIVAVAFAALIAVPLSASAGGMGGG